MLHILHTVGIYFYKVIFSLHVSIIATFFSLISLANASTIIQNGDTVTLSAGETMLVDGDLTIETGGILNGANGAKIRVSGNWANSGTFTHNNSEVYFIGSSTSTVSGTSTFHTLVADLSESDTTSGKSIKFTSGTTQTIINTFKVNGNSSSDVVIDSTISGTQAMLELNGATISASNVDVKDNKAFKSSPTLAAINPTGSINSGNTNGWFTNIATIGTATFDYSTNKLTISGINLVGQPGNNNDIDLTKFTITGASGGTLTLTGRAEIDSSTSFSKVFAGSELTNVKNLLDKDGTKSSDNTTYNISVLTDWNPGASGSNSATNTVTTVLNKLNPTVVLNEILEDSASTGGSNNANNIAVSLSQLSSLPGIKNVKNDLIALYQKDIKSETGFSNPPTVAQVQVIIDRVNGKHNDNDRSPSNDSGVIPDPIASAAERAEIQAEIDRINPMLAKIIAKKDPAKPSDGYKTFLDNDLSDAVKITSGHPTETKNGLFQVDANQTSIEAYISTDGDNNPEYLWNPTENTLEKINLSITNETLDGNKNVSATTGLNKGHDRSEEIDSNRPTLSGKADDAGHKFKLWAYSGGSLVPVTQYLYTKSDKTWKVEPSDYVRALDFGFNLVVLKGSISLPLPVVIKEEITIAKTANKTEVTPGEIITFTNTIVNKSGVVKSNISITDDLPPGFTYIEGSVRSNGVAVEGVVKIGSNDGLQFNLANIPASRDERTVSYQARVSIGVNYGSYNSSAVVVDDRNTAIISDDLALSRRASLTIKVVPDSFFDLSTIIGKVFNDANGNGYQDSGEKPIPYAKLWTSKAQIITTDIYGRYHLANVEPGRMSIKINKSSLPKNTKIISRTTQIIDVKAGIPQKVNFAVQVPSMHNIKARLVVSQMQKRPSPQLNLSTFGYGYYDDSGDFTNPIAIFAYTNFAAFIDSFKVIIKNSNNKIVKEIKGDNKMLFTPIVFNSMLAIDDSWLENNRYSVYLEVKDKYNNIAITKTQDLIIEPFNEDALNVVNSDYQLFLNNLTTKNKLSKNNIRITGKGISVLNNGIKAIGVYKNNDLIMSMPAYTTLQSAQDLNNASIKFKNKIEFILPRGKVKIRALRNFKTDDKNIISPSKDIRLDDKNNYSNPITNSFKGLFSSILNLIIKPSHAAEPLEMDRLSYSLEIPESKNNLVNDNLIDNIDIQNTEKTNILSNEKQEYVVNTENSNNNLSNNIDAKLTGLGSIVKKPKETVMSDVTNMDLLDETQLHMKKEALNESFLLNKDKENITLGASFLSDFNNKHSGDKKHIEEDYVNMEDARLNARVFPAFKDNYREAKDNYVETKEYIDEDSLSMEDARINARVYPAFKNNYKEPKEHIKEDSVNIEDIRLKTRFLPIPVKKSNDIDKIIGKDTINSKLITENAYKELIIEDYDNVEINVGGGNVDDEMVIVGIIDGEIGYREVSGNLELATSGDSKYSKNVYKNGKIQLYLKGTILGRYLITASIDSERKKGDLYKKLDPNHSYPVYGDDSSVVDLSFETDGPLYLLIEKGESFAKWGRFATGFNDVSFATYNKTFQGGIISYESEESDGRGREKTSIKAFGASINSRSAHNEMLSTNGKLYYLKHQHIMGDSVELKIVVKDKINGNTLSEVKLKNSEDFDIDYVSGQIILFKSSNYHANSGFIINSDNDSNNEVYLIADYQYQISDKIDKMTYGIKAQHSISDNFRLGVTHLEETKSDSSYSLRGIDSKIHLDDNHVVQTEYADSKSVSDSNFVSTDGGLTWGTAFNNSTNSYGKAYKVSGNLTTDGNSNVSYYYQNIDSGFSSSSNSQSGEESIGFDMKYNHSDNLNIRIKHDTQKQLDKPSSQVSHNNGAKKLNTTTLQASYNYNKNLNLTGEVRHQDAKGIDVSNNTEANSNSDIVAISGNYRYSNFTDFSLTQQNTINNNSNTNKTTLGASHQLFDNLKVAASVTSGSDQETTYQTNVSYSERLSKKHNDVVLSSSVNTTLNNGDPKTITSTGITYTPKKDITYSASFLDTRDKISDSQSISIGTRQKISENTTLGYSSGFGIAGKNQKDTHNLNLSHKISEHQSVNASVGKYNQNENGVNSDGIDVALNGNINDNWSLSANSGKGYVHRLDGGKDRRQTNSVGLSYVGYDKNKKQILKAKVGYEKRQDRGNSSNSNVNQEFINTSIRGKYSNEVTLFNNLKWSKTENIDTGVVDARNNRVDLGFAYRPINNDKLNIIGKYTYFDNEQPINQSSVANLEADKGQVFAADILYDIGPKISIGTRLAYRKAKEKIKGYDWQESQIWMGAAQLKYKIDKNSGINLEYRRLKDEKLSEIKDGFSIEYVRYLSEDIQAAIGYNQSGFDTDLTDLDYSTKGVYIRATMAY
jgi:uncharacterized repeat protein (TIGR01451 family)